MVKRINVNATQYNVSRTERLKGTNSCSEKMKINLKNDIKIRYNAMKKTNYYSV